MYAGGRNFPSVSSGLPVVAGLAVVLPRRAVVILPTFGRVPASGPLGVLGPLVAVRSPGSLELVVGWVFSCGILGVRVRLLVLPVVEAVVALPGVLSGLIGGIALPGASGRAIAITIRVLRIGRRRRRRLARRIPTVPEAANPQPVARGGRAQDPCRGRGNRFRFASSR